MGLINVTHVYIRVLQQMLAQQCLNKHIQVYNESSQNAHDSAKLTERKLKLHAYKQINFKTHYLKNITVYENSTNCNTTVCTYT